MKTYETLHKDVLLEYKGYGIFDRKVQAGDFVRVEGIDSLYTAICFKIMTIFNELKDNPTFGKWGNKAHYLLKENLNPVNLVAIRDYTEQALLEMRRVKEINSIAVNPDKLDEFRVNVEFSVTAINDETISGGVTIAL
jgi:phage gp46-like protein